jgi:hydrogenase maturation protease
MVQSEKSGGTVKKILVLCAGHPYFCDRGLGFQVAKVLEKMQLPENVEVIEVGESGSEIPHIIRTKDKMIVIDIFQTKNEPGTLLRLKPEEVPVTVDGVTDVGKLHLMELLEQLLVTGDCPETIFVGVAPKDSETLSLELTPEIKKKIPAVVDLILQEIEKA